jgi:hypothetical protein
VRPAALLLAQLLLLLLLPAQPRACWALLRQMLMLRPAPCALPPAAGRTRAPGEINGKSANLNNCLKNMVFKDYMGKVGACAPGASRQPARSAGC